MVGVGGGFGGVTVSRSREVRVGPATFYNAPIHIENFVLHEAPTAPDVEAQRRPDQPRADAGAQNSNVKVHPPWWPWGCEHRLRLLTLACSAASVIAVIIILVVVTRRTASGRADDDDAAALTRDDRPSQNTSGNLTVVPESEWAAEMPHDRRVALRPPVPLVVVSHTYSDECVTYAACVRLLRRLQSFHIGGRAYYDIGYNFMVGGDGYAYEGRGWAARAERSSALADRSVTVSLVGRFGAADTPPSDLQLATLQALVEEGVQQGVLSPDYALVALCQVEHNQSPGQAAYDRLKELPRWVGGGDDDNCTRWRQ